MMHIDMLIQSIISGFAVAVGQYYGYRNAKANVENGQTNQSVKKRQTKRYLHIMYAVGGMLAIVGIAGAFNIPGNATEPAIWLIVCSLVVQTDGIYHWFPIVDVYVKEDKK